METSNVYRLNRERISANRLVPRTSETTTAPKPKLLDQVRQTIRARQYSPRTEEAYVHWIKRFIFFHNKRHPAEMSEVEIAAFLSSLASESRVSASTQNQAFNALLFLYQQVLQKKIGLIEGVVRAKRPSRLPVVLTKEEVGRLLDRLEGAPGDPLELGPARDLTPDRRFKAALEDWRGVASRYSPDELERRIYAITLNDISNVLWEALARHKISIEEFALLGEPRWRVFLDDMPSRRADMQLRKQWAKNAALTPKDSDLNDWAYLGVAVSYCDIVVTEKQVADLFSRGFETRATLVAQLGQLSELVA